MSQFRQTSVKVHNKIDRTQLVVEKAKNTDEHLNATGSHKRRQTTMFVMY